MFRNYFKVALRNLTRNRGFSIVNILGLTIGMASAMLILLWVQDQVGYDRFHAKTDRLYEAWSNNRMDGKIRSLANTPEIMAPTLKKDYPGIERVSRVAQQPWLFDLGDNQARARALVVDADFLQMFSFPLVQGDPATAMANPDGVVISESLAKRLFGKSDALGEVLHTPDHNDYTVTAIAKDPPDNTQFQFECLINYANRAVSRHVDSDWTDISIQTFVLLRPGVRVNELNAQIRDIIPKHSNGHAKTQEFLYPVSRLWLYSNFQDGVATGGRISTIRVFSAIALFILLIACINFMNLSTAQSEKRSKEVGIRKVMGARSSSLVGQFLGESILLACAAGALALVLVLLTLPAFNTLTETRLRLDFGSPAFVAEFIGFVLLTGVLAGSYPAFYMSAFNPVAVLKGVFRKMTVQVTPRKVLVVFQFTIAILLIISTLIIRQQIRYGEDRQAGYDRHNLVYTFIQGDIQKNYDVIREAALQSGAVTSMCKTLSPLTMNWSMGISLTWDGKDPNFKTQIDRYTEDGGLVALAGMHLVKGRDIDVQNFPTDSTACVINESALNLMKFSDPIGETISDGNEHWHVVGVISDFILESPFQQIRPMIIRGPRQSLQTIEFKLNDAHPAAANIANLENIFKRYNPAYPLDAHFTDAEYDQKFISDRLTGKLSALFTGLTILISCLGLFGLSAYMAESRVKEIGVRKVLGASVGQIVTLLSKDFVKLILVAIALASPLAWYAMGRWLESYQYRTPIGIRVFALAAGAAIVCALATICYQAVRAAMANPVKSLRTE